MTQTPLDPDLREYLETLHRMLDQESPKGWPILHALTSLEAMLTVKHLDLPYETDYLRERLVEVERARTVDVSQQDSWREVGRS